jgi:hypothetical protein
MVTRGDARRWWQSPAATTVAFVIICPLVFAAMLQIARYNAIDEAFITGPAFRGWVAAASLGLVVWGVMLGWGVATIRRLDPAWRRTRRWWAGHSAAYAALVASVIVVLALNNANQTIQVPMRGFPTLGRVLIFAGAAAAAPWVLSVWLARDRVRDLHKAVETIKSPEPTDALTVSMLDGPAITVAVRETLAVWKAIERCMLALAVIVCTAVLDSGALRTALIGGGMLSEASFPPTAVLAYGAFFAGALAVAVLPLVRAWRSAAFSLVDRAVGSPQSGVPGQEWLDTRGRLEGHLRIDTNILRRPITVLGLLSPLTTALLTAFVPSAS